jgi:hypothetical protein
MRLCSNRRAVAGGGGPPLFFSTPGRVLSLLGYMPSLAGRAFGSAAIAAGTLVAVDPNGFASMFGTEPELTVSKEGAIHFEDVTPLNIGTPGSPPVVASPTGEAFQTDVLLIRAILWAAWVMRVPGAVSCITTGLSW